jgi:uncharacterized protein YdeI (YjbR/CyaY-like superfamily)
MRDRKGLFNQGDDNREMRSIKFTDVSEIRVRDLTAYVREAVKLNEQGAKVAPRKKPVRVPKDLKEALEADPAAHGFFRSLAPGYRREFVTWVTSAKREATREKRIRETVAKCAREERLNDRYRR